MHRLIISAPFGNYIKPEGATPTLGTFTAEHRPGRLWRILRTVRYYPRLGAWVNRIGLRNPGLAWLIKRVDSGKLRVDDAIVSIHGFSPDDWRRLIEGVASIRPHAIELNMSCPNVGEVDWPEWLFNEALAAMADVGRVIVKLPPVRFQTMSMQALQAGVRCFHCCNTLPVPGGGMSGRPLKPIALRCIADLKAMAAASRCEDGLTIIGGGGILAAQDIDEYAAAGAAHVAIGTKVFSPRYLWSHAGLRPLIEHADRVLASASSRPESGS